MLRLPRQAARLRQLKPAQGGLQLRQLTTSATSQSQAQRRRESDNEPIVVPGGATVPELDPSFAGLIDDMSVGGGRRRKRVYGMGAAPPPDATPEAPAAARVEPEAEEDEFDEYGRRPERRAPATVFGTKHVGQVQLPRRLVEGVTAAIENIESPKIVRDAYLELLKPSPKYKVRGGTNNQPQHALARAAAFLPSQYAAVYNVLKELKTRLGVVTGPILEISFAHGPGFWATHEVFGADAAKNYILVHRTRHGLDLAREFATGLDVNTDTWKRDLVLVEMSQLPQIALSTFELSTLPTSGSRRAHLDKLVDSGAEHIVIVDRATDEGWAAMTLARDHLLAKSKLNSPWRITAPCPHEMECPRAQGREGCAFVQQLQRPPFLRKTKHQKAGEEITGYTYLIMSRGARPSQTKTDQGRVGGVGYDAAVREHEKMEGKSVLREVEGGDIQQFESISLETEKPSLPRQENTPELDATLRDESYSWPRLVAPPMKRKGRVIMDACTADGNIQRFIVSKKHGKQDYHDARKSMWGDLYAHEIKSKREVRTRGVRLLTDEPAELKEERQRQAAVAGSEVEEGQDEEVAALLKQLGMTMPEAEWDLVDAEDGMVTEEVMTTTAEAAEVEEEPKKERRGPTPRAPGGMNRAARRRLQFGDGGAKEGDGAVDAVLGTLQDAVAPEAEGTAAAGSSQSSAGPSSNFTSPPLTRSYSTMTRPGARTRTSGLGLATVGLRTPYSRPFSTSRPTHSAQPGTPPQKINVQKLQALHDDKIPITMLTAYDYPTALVCSKAGVDVILVGDSLAQVALGLPSTVPLTLDEMSHHVRAVARGAGKSFLLVDLPFGYMEESVAAGAKAAVRLIKDGADGIKIEGGREIIPLVRRMAEHGVPVMPHIGLQPQRANTTGYRAQGRTAAAAVDLVEVAKEMEAAGAFGLLLEAIPHQVGSAIAKRVNIPTIGIGAGADTSGQVLVFTDMAAVYDMGTEEERPKPAKFVRSFAPVGQELRRAVDSYCQAVRDRSYPSSPKETYTMPKEEAVEFRRLIGEEVESKE